MSKNDKVVDLSYYKLAEAAYLSDKNIKKEFDVKDSDGNVVQTWTKGETFHDKQTGMDAVAFERVIDGKKQVMVAFRGTEGDKIFEKDSLKPGEGMKEGCFNRWQVFY